MTTEISVVIENKNLCDNNVLVQRREVCSIKNSF